MAIFSGGTGGDNYTGTSDDDTINGFDGNDNLSGEGGNDFIDGGNGDDYLVGGAGNDTIDGGSATTGDTVDYSSAAAGVNVNLQSGVATDGLGGTDSLVSIESVNGSGFNDTLTGTSGGNLFRPGAGNDSIVTNGGNDAILYESAGSAIVFNLLTGTVTGGAGNDTITGAVKGAHGSAFNDVITLANNSGYVFARAGNDSLAGGSGDDNFIPGSGNDTVAGGAGFDQLTYDNDGFEQGGPSPTGVGVTVNLVTGTATDNWGNQDVFSSIELVAGSQFADMLLGGNPANGSGATDGFEGFTGNGGNDTINGGTGFDRAQYTTSTSGVSVTLGGTSNGTAQDGLGGTDTLISIEEARGSSHNDTLTGSNTGGFESFEGRGGNDTVNGLGGADRVNFQSSPAGVNVNLATGTASDGWGGSDSISNVENVRASEHNDTLTGDSGKNDLDARGGNDSLSGGAGEDFLRGGNGNDTLDGGANLSPANTANSNSEYDGAYYGDAGSGVTVVLGATGTAGTATGGGGNDLLIDIEQVVGSNHNDVISGTNRAMNELIRGGAGNDTLSGGHSSGTDAGFNLVDYRFASGGVAVDLALGEAFGADGHDRISGFRGLIGGEFGDMLRGAATDDHIEGRGGNDTIDGGEGKDRASYWESASAVNINLLAGTATGGQGTDRLISIENARGSDHADTIIGDAGSNDLQGRGGSDTLIGGAGEDTVYGGAGDDSMMGGANDTLLGFDWASYSAAGGAINADMAAGLVTGAEGTDSISGFEALIASAFADTLTGDAGDNILRGNGGNDIIDGGDGQDAVDYQSSGTAVVVSLVTGTSSGGDGVDAFTNIERIRGSHFNDSLTGDANDNRLRGNQGDDTLDGGGGQDNADYYNATGAVMVDLSLGLASGADGTDTLVSIEGVLGSYNHGDTLLGSSGANFIDGRAGADTISGGDGDDTLQGSAGNDVIDGGAGFDTAVFTGRLADYQVSVEIDNFDLIIRGPDGIDRIRNVEAFQFDNRTLVLKQGTNVAEGLGGTAGADFLQGRGGNDSIDGGVGDDAVYGDEGVDSLDGGTGDDFLDGGTGADTMTGGTGDDEYVVDELGDVVDEGGPLGRFDDPLAQGAGGGVDTVIASITYTLASFVENLVLAPGVAALHGTGNGLSNTLTGNEVSNVLTGAQGNDSLVGGEGVDTATYTGTRAQYELHLLAESFTVNALGTAIEGNDVLTSIERLQFSDGLYAIDMNGSAGLTARLAHTLFGAGSVNDQQLIGYYLALFDQGLNYEDVATAMVISDRFALVAGSHSNAAFVNTFYAHLTGTLPDAATFDLLVGLLDAGTYTQGAMATLAADYAVLGPAIADAIAYAPQVVAAAAGGDGNDSLAGGAGHDLLIGRVGHDDLDGGTGNDTLLGGEGVDLAVMGGARGSFTIARNELGLLVSGQGAADQLIDVERVAFTNHALAFDLDANAGTAAKIIGAMFGLAGLADTVLVGEYLAMLDSGMTYEEVTGFAAASDRFGLLAGSHSNHDFFFQVYENIAGFQPTEEYASTFIALLDTPGYSQAYVAMLAAEIDHNVAHIGLAGLAVTGLAYTPDL